MRVRPVVRGFIGATLVTATLGASAACTDTRGRLYVRVGPPAPIIEARIAAPGAGYVWIEGYQRWDGGRYLWVPGRWVMPPRPRARWVAGHWSRDRRGWYWVDGHWR